MLAHCAGIKNCVRLINVVVIYVVHCYKSVKGLYYT